MIVIPGHQHIRCPDIMLLLVRALLQVVLEAVDEVRKQDFQYVQDVAESPPEPRRLLGKFLDLCWHGSLEK
jgi:hypothetical protein